MLEDAKIPKDQINEDGPKHPLQITPNNIGELSKRYEDAEKRVKKVYIIFNK